MNLKKILILFVIQTLFAGLVLTKESSSSKIRKEISSGSNSSSSSSTSSSSSEEQIDYEDIEIPTFTPQEFDQKIVQVEDHITVVFFGATWCPHCKALKPKY